MKNFLFVANSSWYLYNFRSETLKSFAQYGSVFVIVGDGQYKENLVNLGCEVIIVENDPTSINLLALFNQAKLIKRACRPHKFNHTFVFGIRAILVCSIALGLSKNKTAIVSGLGQLKVSKLYYLMLLTLQISLTQYQSIVCQNDDDQQRIAKKLLGRLLKCVFHLQLGSGVYVENKNISVTIDQITNGRILFISRLLKSKGILDFAKLCEQKKGFLDNREFHAFGELDFKNRDTISESEFQYVKSIGVKSMEFAKNKSSLYQRGDILTFLSKYGEGFPRTILEAMANGIPVIVLKNAFLSEWILQESALIVIQEFDCSLFYNEIIKLTLDVNYYNDVIKRNQRFVEKYASIDENVKNFLNIAGLLKT